MVVLVREADGQVHDEGEHDDAVEHHERHPGPGPVVHRIRHVRPDPLPARP